MGVGVVMAGAREKAVCLKKHLSNHTQNTYQSGQA